MFQGYFASWPFSLDNGKINSLTRLFSFQSCASQLPFSREPFLRTSCELLVKLHWFFISYSILHQLNTKLNTIKFHKIQGTKLKQLHYFLSWNKANIKHSYKSQFYNLYSIILPMINDTHLIKIRVISLTSNNPFKLELLSLQVKFVACKTCVVREWFGKHICHLIIWLHKLKLNFLSRNIFLNKKITYINVLALITIDWFFFFFFFLVSAGGDLFSTNISVTTTCGIFSFWINL